MKAPQHVSPQRTALELSTTDLPAVLEGRRASVAVVLRGRLDAVEAPALRAEFARIVPTRPAVVVVDLADVSFVDSAGLAALVRFRRELHGAGGDLVLVRPNRADAFRVFRLTQFDEVFLLVASRGCAEAVGAGAG